MADTSPPLQSSVLQSPADGLLIDAITCTLLAEASARADILRRCVGEIEAYISARPQERAWTCSVWTGTDGAHIFRGGVGHSLVIDGVGRLWQARSYEDFETTYIIAEGRCDIATLTPVYAQMRQYRVNVRRLTAD